MDPTECLGVVAATLHPQAKDEVEKLYGKLLHAAPERELHVLMQGAGTYGGLDHLCQTYGTATTAATYVEVLTAMRMHRGLDTSPIPLCKYPPTPQKIFLGGAHA